MKIVAILVRSLALIFLLTLPACHATQAPVHHGCFNPVPAKSVHILRRKNPQLRWAAAHRGDRDAGPDNSLTAILSAARHSVPLIEVDVRSSADGKLFLFHDRHLNANNIQGPSTWAGRAPQELRSPELQQLRLPGTTDEHVIFLDQALTAIRKFPSALLLDLKGESPLLATQVIKTAQAYGALDNIVLQCQSFETARFIRAHFPGAAVLVRAYSPAQIVPALALIPRPEIVQVDSDWINLPMVEEIHEAGSYVLVKTLEQSSDQPAVWNSLMDIGVDIILTDHPRAFVRSIPRSCEAR